MRMWIEIRQFQIYISHQVVILYMRMWIEILPVVTAWYLSRVILYMRMWIEIFHQSIYTQPILVILYMRMWIEMIQNPEILQIGDASSSIWGCELKYGVFLSWYHIHIGHPLYEDVNWNSTEVFANDPYFRHPLYEDVNWNICRIRIDGSCPVILYMRMWIEMELVQKKLTIWWRHPLYEDVNWNSKGANALAHAKSHPLYEDVNWNTTAFP